jgi:hypothetical protein
MWGVPCGTWGVSPGTKNIESKLDKSQSQLTKSTPHVVTVASKESKLGKSEIKTLQRPLLITFWSIHFWADDVADHFLEHTLRGVLVYASILLKSHLSQSDLVRITFWSTLFLAESQRVNSPNPRVNSANLRVNSANQR